MLRRRAMEVDENIIVGHELLQFMVHVAVEREDGTSMRCSETGLTRRADP